MFPFFWRWCQFSLKVLLSWKTSEKAKRVDVYLPAKSTSCWKTTEISIWQKNQATKSYALNKHVLYNSKYFKTKQNQKHKNKFFGSFQVLHPMNKETYKLKLLAKWKIHYIFHMSLLE